jgi:hypothetical protein
MNGTIKVFTDMASRKQVDDKGKIKKQQQTEDTTDVENVKPVSCDVLSVAQQEIINAIAASALYTQTLEGDELLAQYLVVERCFGKARWTEGADTIVTSKTRRRWERLNTDYPAEQIINADELEAIGMLEPDKLDYALYAAMPKATREHLFFAACAALIYVPHGQQVLKPGLRELAQHDWVQPGEDFFKRYRTDQLIDYRRRCGDKEAGKTPKKKGDHVADCVVAAVGPRAYKFGYGKKKA